MKALLLLLALGLVGGVDPQTPSVDGLWRYSHARCPQGDVTPQGYVQHLVIQGEAAAQESAVEGCASLTRGITRRWTPDGAVLRYTGGLSVCTPAPMCFGTFELLVLGRVSAATYSCSSGPTFGESGPYTLEGADTLVSPIPGERGCTSVWARIPGPTGVLP